MTDRERPDARLRDLCIALVPILLLTSLSLLVFLIRQVYGPADALRAAWWSVAALPVLGAAFTFWSPWHESLNRSGWQAARPAARLLLSAPAFTVVALLAWAGPWFVVRRIVDLASPFESMQWILTTGIILHGLVFRAVLSRRRVPAWMGVLYWLACAAIGLGLWNRVAALFA